MIGHLLFAHMLADYVLQTNWLVVRKGKRWDGLILHGFMVWLMAIIALASQINTLLIPISVLALLHTGQDWLKVYLTPRLKVPVFYSYMADQVSHYLMIIGMHLLFNPLLSPPIGAIEAFAFGIGACVITITRFYEVTWWANFMQMKLIPYFTRWRWFEYAEHLAIFALCVAGLFYLAPLCVIPRLFAAYRAGQPIWKQPYGVAEMVLGVILSMALGIFMATQYPAGLR